MRRLAICFIAASLLGCKWRPLRKNVQDAGADAAVAQLPEEDAGPPASQTVEAKDLPLGSWESSAGSKLSLSIFPDGLVRFGTEVPSYRNGARVFGQIHQAESDDPNAFRIWVDVTKIYAKEIGPAHRKSVDFELFEAELLDQRVTSPNNDAQKIPQLGGKGPEAARGYALKFDPTRTTLDVCTLATPPKCQTLTKAKSPSDISRVRTNGLCKYDDDCVLATDGEQCDPCLCPSKASLKTWPRKPKPDDDKEDLSWQTTDEHLCGKDVPRRDDCAACPTLRVVCKNKACVLKN